MANIPSHMRIQSDVGALRRTPQTSYALLVVLGGSIGLAVAAVTFVLGLAH